MKRKMHEGTFLRLRNRY